MAVLDEVRALVRERFYDLAASGTAWEAACERARPEVAAARDDTQLSRAINALLATLGASHTEFRTRSEPRAYELADVFWESLPQAERERWFGREGPVVEGIGILVDEREGESLVRAVLDGSPAERAGLRAGDRLLGCEGRPFAPVDTVESFRGRAGRATRLRVRADGAGEERELVVVPDALRPGERYLAALRVSARVIERKGTRLAYVHVWSYAGEEVQQTLRELLLAGELAGADGLVLDLRDGLGGANPDALALFSRELPAITWKERDGTSATLASSWTKPVVLLVDGRTTSGKEVFAHAFRAARRGPIVGTRTAGTVLGGSLFLLGDGSVLYLAVRDVHVGGVRLEGVGVMPDFVVPFDRAAGGEDPQLARALEVLRAELQRR